AGVVPAAGKGLRAGLGIVPVAGRDVRARDDDFSDLARLAFRAVFADDFHTDSGRGSPAGAEKRRADGRLLVSKTGHDRSRLGCAVKLRELRSWECLVRRFDGGV